MYGFILDPPRSGSEARERLRRLPRRIVQKKPLRERDKRSTLVYSALLGVSVIAVVQLLSLEELGWFLSISVLFFALAIPALTATVYIINQSRKGEYQYEVQTLWTFLMDLAGVLFSLAGITGLFLHLWWVAGVLFVLFIAAAFAILMHYLAVFTEVNAAEVLQDAEEDT